jgi:signal peptidase I
MISNNNNDDDDDDYRSINDNSSSNASSDSHRPHHQRRPKWSNRLWVGCGRRTRRMVLPNEIKYVIIAFAAVAIIWFSLKLYLHVDNPLYVVSSESMVPTLMVGDIVVLRNSPTGGGFSFSDLHVGDIIVFHTTDGGGRTIVHRVVQIYHDNGISSSSSSSSSGNNSKGTGAQQLVKTKGDHNPISYNDLDYPIKEADYYGKVIFVIPKVGLIFRILTAAPNISYVILLAVSAIVAATVIVSIRHRKLTG